MDTLWKTALWQQFGATIDMLDNALLTCPDTLWKGHVWSVQSDQPLQPEFWYVTYHVLFWLDLYLTGSHEGFAPPAPFSFELEAEGKLPEQPYTRDELRAYLLSLRKKCQMTIMELTDEKASQRVAFPWMTNVSFSFLELQLYNMRHVQEHAAQLNLFLGQNAVDGVSDWVPQANIE